MNVETYLTVNDASKVDSFVAISHRSGKTWGRSYSTGCRESFFYRIHELHQSVWIAQQNNNLRTFRWSVDHNFYELPWLNAMIKDALEKYPDGSVRISYDSIEVKDNFLPPLLVAAWFKLKRDFSWPSNFTYSPEAVFRVALDKMGMCTFVKFLAGWFAGVFTDKDFFASYGTVSGPQSFWDSFCMTDKPNRDRINQTYEWMVEAYPSYFEENRKEYQGHKYLNEIITSKFGPPPLPKVGTVDLPGFTNEKFIVYLQCINPTKYSITGSKMHLGCTSKAYISAAGRKNNKIKIYVLVHQHLSDVGKDFDVHVQDFKVIPNEEAIEIMQKSNVTLRLKKGKIYIPKVKK